MKHVVLFVLLMALCAGLQAQAKCPCTAVCNVPNAQQAMQHVVPDGLGGAIVAWQDMRNGVDWDIYAQRIDAYGNMLWAPNGILICGAPQGIMGYQGHLSITPSGPDFIITWEDCRMNPLSIDIYAQKIDINGFPLWPVGGMPVCLDNVSNFYPMICEDGAGGAFITWFDDRAGIVANDYNIYAEWINATGVPASPPAGMLVSSAPWSLGTNQTNPVICADQQGGAIIAYESVQGNTLSDIYAQGLVKFPLFGLAYPLEVPISAALQNQLYPQIVNDQPGGAVICWEDYIGGGPSSDIYAQAILNGVTSWPLNGIIVSPLATGAQNLPKIAACGANSAIITWEEGFPPNCDILAQKVVAGLPVWPSPALPAPVPVCIALQDQLFPEICPDGNNGAFIVWEDRRDIVTPSYDIYGEQVDTNGNILGPTPGSGVALCTFAGLQQGPMLANNKPNQAIYVWVDTRNTPPGTTIPEYDLYTMDPADPPPEPVEMSSFTATATAENSVLIKWASQSESQLIGYRVYRAASESQSASALIDHPLIPATNTSTTQSYSVTDFEVAIGSTYYYWLEVLDYVSSVYFGPVSVIVSGNVPPVLPEYTSLRDAYPNPFQSSASIDVSLKAGETGVVTIYNVAGRAVKTFAVSEGTHSLVWDGNDNKGTPCGTGIYFYKLQTPSFNQTRKMMLIK